MAAKTIEEPKKERFDELMTKLGGIVERLEQADLPLEESLEQFAAGVDLSRRGQKILDDAEAKVEQLLADGSTAPMGEEDNGRS